MSGTIPESLPILGTPGEDEFDLVEMLLAEQQSLTAVERFSAFHETHEEGPAQERYYRDLLPASPPKSGQQYAFKVDLDACSGCKACVVACHTLNGLEEEETWRKVGTLTQGQGSESRVQHVTTACHHCEDPGCLNGCPVKAYTKDPSTGIVQHHDDQCIGCKYCTMMCPYEVPQYSDRLGIVRKCDMCHQRLSVGEAPACVQSCPNEAISIQIVESNTGMTGRAPRLVPGAPISDITRPSTNFVSRYPELISEATPQDEKVDEVAESHWPLALMLVLTQISVGMLVVERVAATLLWVAGSQMPIEATRINSLTSLVVAIVGLNLASLHLGQPLRAWRVFLGLRTSWLSREAVVLGKYTGALVVSVALLWLPTYVDYVPDAIASRVPSWAANAMLGTALVLGLIGLYSSAMIYIATKRQLWRYQRTLIRFFGSSVVGGLFLSLPCLVGGSVSTGLLEVMMLASTAVLIAKLTWEWRCQLGPGVQSDDQYDVRCRKLTQHQLQYLRTLRIVAGIVAVGLVAFSLLTLPIDSVGVSIALTSLAALTLIVGEISERLLYFTSVVYDRMPGTLR
ncbi:MAG: DmsC/YnfH family molybdoenzyme membrane anchor subunit [Rubripirellula sp.]